MWTRRDYITLATSAIAAFSIATAVLSTGSLNAGDEKPAATADVKIPTLQLDGIRVTAAVASEKDHTVSFTVLNATGQPLKAEFTAQASNAAPTSRMSRVMQLPKAVWSENFVIDLKPLETTVITHTLPEEAFAYVGQTIPAPANQFAATTAGRTFLILAPTVATDDKTKMLFGLPNQVEVLTLSAQIQADAVAQVTGSAQAKITP